MRPTALKEELHNFPWLSKTTLKDQCKEVASERSTRKKRREVESCFHIGLIHYQRVYCDPNDAEETLMF